VILKKEQRSYLEENLGKTILPLSIFENEMRPGTEPLEVLIFYKKKTPIQKLKDSFFKAAEYYNLFSSRLIMIDDNKYALHHCKEGINYHLLPPLNVTFDHANIDEIRKMIVPVETLPGEPMVALTGIPIKDGVFGGISCSHAMTDGISLLLFLFAWSCIIEEKEFLPPSPQRLFKGEPVRFDEIDKAFIPCLSELSDKIQNRVKYRRNVTVYSKKEYFSDDFLEEVKKKAKKENDKYFISNNQIINSFLLKKYHKYILPDTDSVRVRIPINFRGIHPEIDPCYIGTAYFIDIVEFSKTEINKLSMYEIAYRLHESITSSRNVDYIKKISYLSDYGIEIKTDMLKNFSPYDWKRDIVSSNLTHLNDLESMGLGSNVGSIVHIGVTAPSSFAMMKEKNGSIFAQITSQYPLP